MGVMHQLMIRPVQSRYGILYDGMISQLNDISFRYRVLEF